MIYNEDRIPFTGLLISYSQSQHTAFLGEYPKSPYVLTTLSIYFLSINSAKTLTRTSREGENKITIFKLLIKPNAIKGREITSFEGKCEMQRVTQLLKAFPKRSFPKVSRDDVIQRVQHLTSNWQIKS